MRPPRDKRSALRYPLDVVFGSEVQVRLVRVLAHEVAEPLSVTDAARLAGVTTVGARKALDRLESVGFAEHVGSGRALKFGLRRDAVALQPLVQAFEQEQQRYEELVNMLRKAVALNEVSVAWLEPLPHLPTEALHVVVVVDVKAIGWIRDELRTRLVDLERQFDVVVEVLVMTRAEEPEPGPAVEFLWGSVTLERAPEGRNTRTHEEASERSLLMAKAITDLIRSDPTLITRAKQHINRLLHEGQGAANADLAEWRQLLETYSPDRVRDVLVSSSSRAERLRQSSPFFAVLSAEERNELVRSVDVSR
jgi:hypothetical protein